MAEIGIKETKEALLGATAIVKDVMGRLGDGFQAEDVDGLVARLQTDEAFARVVAEAIIGAHKIPAEIKDITISEGVELAFALLSDLK